MIGLSMLQFKQFFMVHICLRLIPVVTWDIKTGSANSIADWRTPIPSLYNNFLVSFSQEYGNSKFAIAVANQSIALDVFPETGTDASAHTIFRLILNDLSTKLSTANDAFGKSVILELFYLPGKVLVQQGKDKNLGIADMSSSKDSSVFQLVPGLDGKNTTVSFKSESFKGCFVHSENIVASAGMKLVCSPESSDAGFNQAASFVKSNGISQHHPISFVAKGATRSFLLAPLSSFNDESYTAYLNITA
ncbi:unnamed protein product [Prunus armeniaca]|nr:hypothetical protein GBA52_021726 [Prunus armeniaca]